jgi:hypothetical protein
MIVRRLARWLGTSEASDEGAILVLAAFLMILIFAAAALAIDVTTKSQHRSDLWATSDAAALAGASQLPDFPAGAKSEALKFALANDPSLAGGVNPTFRCVVGDRDRDGQPDPFDIPQACNPGPPSPPAPPTLTGFICADGVCAAPCNPDLGHKCNTIVLETDKTTDYAFAPVIGIDSGDTSVLSAACRGTCGGGAAGPIDLMIIIDRTGSMNDANNSLDKAKDAALAVLDYFDPSLQHVGLGVLGAGNLGVCNDLAPTIGGSSWLGVPLSSDFKDNPDTDVTGDGIPDLDGSSVLVQKIKCLTFSGQGTNLGSPIRDDEFGRPDTMSHLLSFGRPGVKKGIILLSDGAGTEPDPEREPCQYAAEMAAKAKAAGIEIFTIGLGVQGDICGTDGTGPYVGAPVTRLLANMASNSVDNCSGPNPELENTDGDHFFCEPKSGDLASVFLAAASQFAGGSKLIQLPPGA